MRLRFPHPLTLLVGFIALVAVLSWVLPAGQFERRDGPMTGRKVVVAGTRAWQAEGVAPIYRPI